MSGRCIARAVGGHEPAEDRIFQTAAAVGGTTDDEPCGELNVVQGWLLPRCRPEDPPQSMGSCLCGTARPRALLLQMSLEEKRRCLRQGRRVMHDQSEGQRRDHDRDAEATAQKDRMA
jgi:hypothetical protein